MSNQISTHSSGWVDYANPKLEDIKLADMVTGISNICRFNGQCRFYSVAEHSLICCLIAEEFGGDPFEALVHDLHEGLIGDVPKPLKLMLPDFNILEMQFETLMRIKFGLEPEMTPAIKDVDLMALKAEREILFPDITNFPEMPHVRDVNIRIRHLSPDVVAELFYIRFNELF